ncbi:MAG: hypothetical protein WBY94_12260, partial [Polyangiaceae bacterium]
MSNDANHRPKRGRPPTGSIEWADEAKTIPAGAHHEGQRQTSVHPTRSGDDAGGSARKGTKTGTTRRIPIEPALAPVLARLRAEGVQARGKRAKHVLWMPDHEDRAILLRQHLQTAQVTRAELFES